MKMNVQALKTTEKMFCGQNWIMNDKLQIDLVTHNWNTKYKYKSIQVTKLSLSYPHIGRDIG